MAQQMSYYDKSPGVDRAMSDLLGPSTYNTPWGVQNAVTNLTTGSKPKPVVNATPTNPRPQRAQVFDINGIIDEILGKQPAPVTIPYARQQDLVNQPPQPDAMDFNAIFDDILGKQGSGVLAPPPNEGGATGSWDTPMQMPPMNIAGEAPKAVAKKTTANKGKGKVTYSPFPPKQAAPIGPVQAPIDPLSELAKALKAREDAINMNSDNYRDLASKLGVHQAVPGFGGLMDYANLQTGANFKPVQDETFNQKQNLLAGIQDSIAKNNIAATSPGVDLANTKMKLKQFNDQIAAKKGEGALSRAHAEKLMRMRINGALAAKKAAASGKTSKGMEQFSKKTADGYDLYASGGKEALNSTALSLDDSMSKLKGIKTGGWKAAAFKLAPNSLQGFVDSDMKALVDNVIAPVFETLKSKIGAQFTERESLQLQNLSFDPALSNEQNRKKIENALYILKSKQEALQHKYSYFEKNNGDMTGFKIQEYDIPTPIQKSGTPTTKSVDDMSEAELDAIISGG